MDLKENMQGELTNSKLQEGEQYLAQKNMLEMKLQEKEKKTFEFKSRI